MASDSLVDAADANRQIVDETVEPPAIELDVNIHLVDECVPAGDKVFQPIEQIDFAPAIGPLDRR